MNVPGGLATELLPWLQELPEFDNMAVIEASGCIHINAFFAWRAYVIG